MLIGKGVTAWRHVLAEITPIPPPPAADPCTRATSRLPARLAAELVNALAALALAGT